jgi:hypothetical protein
VLVNLQQRNGFELPERRLFGMQILTEIIRESFRREARTSVPRVPCYLFIDECQDFICQDIEDILAKGRGYNLRLILAHQTLSQLVDPETGSRRLYDLVNECTDFKAVFRVKMGETSKSVAETVFGATLDPMREKRRIEQTKQLSEVVDVVDHSYGSADGDALARQDGTSSGTITPPHDPSQKGSVLPGETNQTNSSTTAQRTHTDQHSEIHHKAVHPGRPFKEVTSIESMSLEEQLFEQMAKLSQQATGDAVIAHGTATPAFITVAHVDEPAITSRQTEALDLRLMRRAPHYYTESEAVRAAMRERVQRVIEAPSAGLDITPADTEWEQDPPDLTESH